MMSVTGADGSPAAPRPAIGDHPTAMSLFGAIMLGLYRRERTGRGGRVTTSLLASGAWANACDIQAKLLDAEFPQRSAGAHPPNPLTAAYLSRDGKIFLLILIDPEVEFPRLCGLLGQPDLAESDLFSSNSAREANAAALYEILRAQFEASDLALWAEAFKRNDIKWAPLPPLDDVVRDPQMRAAQAIIGLEHPRAGRIETVNSPIFIDAESKCQPSPAPAVGAHTREILEELGYDDAEIQTLLRLTSCDL
jgi:formyl-CoA transferase